MDNDINNYIKLNSEVIAAEEALEKLKAQRSAMVKAIHDAQGKGPYTIEGKTMFIFSRGDTWFFSLPRGKAKG